MADGLWSQAPAQLGFKAPPRFAGRTAWRALLPATAVAAEYREPLVALWLGPDAHLVHYPVKDGQLINIVVITTDRGHTQSSGSRGWSEPGSRTDLLALLPASHWAPQARALVGLPEAWLKWPLYDRRPLPQWSRGAAVMLGDAAHPMLPFLAQGAAMAIEDAAVLAQCLARQPDDPAAAVQSYVGLRRARVWKVQRLAARNGERYHLRGLAAILRNVAMRAIGGGRLLAHYDWLYDWRPPEISSLK
jgi:salicylate hydroxylase